MSSRDLGQLDGRLLIFGGPYSNLAATRAMREKAGLLGIGPASVICTGDLVAYCAEPAETVELVRDWGIHVVMGNCEESLATRSDDCGCGFDEGSSCSTLSVTWYRYADARITSRQREWMAGLPRSLGFRYHGWRFRVIHAGVDHINRFVFASDPAGDKLDQLRRANADIIIGGHCGLPFGQPIDDRYWLNAGVIGMPANDGSPDVWYLLIEPTGDGLVASWHRLDYDFELSSRSTVAAGMVEYGEALKTGLWPSLDILPGEERKQRGRRLVLEPLNISRN